MDKLEMCWKKMFSEFLLIVRRRSKNEKIVIHCHYYYYDDDGSRRSSSFQWGGALVMGWLTISFSTCSCLLYALFALLRLVRVQPATN